MVGGQELVVGLDDGELEAEPLRILEAKASVLARRLDAAGPKPLFPEVQRPLRGNPPRDRVDHPGARTPWARVRVLEERDVGAGAPLLVRVEQVVDRWGRPGSRTS